MKAYFVASQEDFSIHKQDYQIVAQLLRDANIEFLNDDWLADYEAVPLPDTSSKYYESAMKQIADADIVIFDATISSMGVGHQLTYSLYLQKPTLLLLNSKFKQPEDLFIAGSNSPSLTISSYATATDIKAAVEPFITKNRFSKKGRLNLALDQRQQEYLRWGSYYYNISKTDIVKRAIDTAIDQDKNYTN